jgi:hypothetical protein
MSLRRDMQNAKLSKDYVDLFSDLSFDNVAQVSQMLMDNFSSWRV